MRCCEQTFLYAFMEIPAWWCSDSSLTEKPAQEEVPFKNEKDNDDFTMDSSNLYPCAPPTLSNS